MEQFNQVADGWIEKLTTVADGKTPINMVDYMCRVTMEMVAKVPYCEIVSDSNVSILDIRTTLMLLFI